VDHLVARRLELGALAHEEVGGLLGQRERLLLLLELNLQQPRLGTRRLRGLVCGPALVEERLRVQHALVVLASHILVLRLLVGQLLPERPLALEAVLVLPLLLLELRGDQAHVRVGALRELLEPLQLRRRLLELHAQRLLGEVAALELALQRHHLRRQLLPLRRELLAHLGELLDRLLLLVTRALLVEHGAERLLAQLGLALLLLLHRRLELALHLPVAPLQVRQRRVERLRAPGVDDGALATLLTVVLELELEEVHLLLEVVDVLLLERFAGRGLPRLLGVG